MTEPGLVEVTVHIAARPETVFTYFTDPVRYVQWMGSRATLEPVPGGVYRVGMRDGVQAAGEFVEVDPPHRLVFTWGWTHDHAVAPGSTRVVVTLGRGGRRHPRRPAPLRPARRRATRAPPQAAGNCTWPGWASGSPAVIPAPIPTPEPPTPASRHASCRRPCGDGAPRRLG